jgi:rubrerythrin
MSTDSCYDEILAFAIEKERGAERFYLQWADRAEDPEVRELLRHLASDEQRHARRLEEIDAQELLGSGRPPSDFRLADLIEEAEPRETMTLVDALSIAIQREVRAIELYERLRRHASTGEKLFAALADDERRHKHQLELRYATLSRRGASP